MIQHTIIQIYFKKHSLKIKSMQPLNPANPPPQAQPIPQPQQAANQNTQPQRNKQIIYIITIYLLITISSHLTSNQTSAFSKNVINIINTPQNISPNVKTIMSLFAVDNYQGNWKSNNFQTLNLLNNGQGRSKMKFQKFGTPQNTQYQFQFQNNNGKYIDNGDILLRCVINADKLQSKRYGTTIIIGPKKDIINTINVTNTKNNNNKKQQDTKNKDKGNNENNNDETINDSDTVFPNSLKDSTLKTQQSSQKLSQTTDSQQILAFYRQQYVLKAIQQKIITLSNFNLNLTFSQQTHTLSIIFTLQSENKFSFAIQILKQQSKMFSTIIFAVLLFIISYMQFSAIMQMLKSIFQGRQSASHYSIITVLIATMWDAVICVIAFIQAFRNQQSLILFIMPAFLLCLLFTNLQLRILLMIFQARSDNTNLRQVICKFNIVTYGGLILMYPLLIYTNLSVFFFIFISLIFIPQIYSNAMNGHRPNIASAFYTKFLSFRFLLIIYLKCFPWNIFQLEPNYLLGFTCIALLSFQLFLLWIQKVYGPKKVLPRFLLPPVFNYDCEIEMNVQQGTQMSECAICLSSLHQEPQPGANSSLNAPFRVMKGPCGHKFHGSCLSQWMQIKMECPQCRRKLPPFQ